MSIGGGNSGRRSHCDAQRGRFADPRAAPERQAIAQRQERG
jgi:hypothetical protein